MYITATIIYGLLFTCEYITLISQLICRACSVVLLENTSYDFSNSLRTSGSCGSNKENIYIIAFVLCPMRVNKGRFLLTLSLQVRDLVKILKQILEYIEEMFPCYL